MTDKPSIFSSLWRHLRDFWPVGFVILLILLLVAPALSPSHILMPLDIVTQSWAPWQPPNQPVDVHNFLQTDVVNYIVPMKQFLVRSLQEGVFPLWNPYLFTGYPFTYNTQAGAWYPLTALYYILPLTTAVDATVILQMILGAVFMYGYLRALKLKQLAAVVGTVVFIFNGLMIIWLEWQVVHAAIIWLPLQLWLVEKLRHKLQTNADKLHRLILRYSLVLGILFAIPWLGGHWNWTLYASMVLALYLLWRIVPLVGEPTTAVAPKHLFLLFTITFGVGIGLSLIQVLPAFAYLAESHRGGISYDRALRESLFNRFVVAFIPNFFGDPIQRNFWGAENYAETTFYLGILPLFLAVMAIFLRRDRITLFFTGLGALGVLWALRTPLYYLLYVLPVFNGLFPSRAIYLTVVSTAVLSALSIDVLQTKADFSRRRLGIVLLVTTVVFVAISVAYFWYYRAEVSAHLDYLQPYLLTAVTFAGLSLILLTTRLMGWLPPRIFAIFALLCIALDLFVFGYGYNSISSLDDWYGATAVANFYHQETDPYRIATPAKGMVYPPNSAIVDEIPNISGYEPGILQRTVDYLNMAEGGSSLVAERAIMPLNALDSPLLDAVNVKYIPTTRDRSAPDPQVGVAQETADQSLPLAANISLLIS